MVAKSHTVRLNENIEKRLDRIAVELSRRANGVKITQSDVIRQIVEQGLPTVEKQLGLKG